VAVPRPRFAGSYAANAILVVLSISPGLCNGAALNYVFPQVAHDLGAAARSTSWLPTLTDAAIAFGGIIAAELSRHVEARRLYLATLIVALVSAAVGMAANSVDLLIATQVVHGIVSGFMLVIAIGPLISGFGEAKLPLTAAIGIAALFGVGALAPLFGALAASVHDGWRIMFAIEAALGLLALWLARETIAEKPAKRTSDFVDVAALTLSIGSTLLIFAGVAACGYRAWSDPSVWLPLALGNGGLVALLVIEARTTDPLLPVRELGRAYPLVGAFACVFASGVYAAATRGISFFLSFVQGFDRLAVAGVLSVAVLGALLSAPIYARVVATRWGSPAALAGLALLLAGCSLAATFGGDTTLSEVCCAMLLLALGAGLTITPGIFTMALGVDGRYVGRAVALLALLRMNASYLSGPVLSAFAAARTAAHVRVPGVTPASLGAMVRDYVVAGAAPLDLNPAVRAQLEAAFIRGSHDGFTLLAGASLLAILVVLAIFRVSGLHLTDPKIRCFVTGQGFSLESPLVFAPHHEAAN
jgi:MFS family permease